jgi:feruloyl esterase
VGNIAPTSAFEINLPIERWTQRFVQGASTNGLRVATAGSCFPATNGEMVMAGNDKGGGRDDRPAFDAQKRIAWAYTANHDTAVVAKAVIKAFYGQPPRFSYYVGCSGGGREALIEAQRFPDDFDGISAGAPAMLLSIHNGGFFHGWERRVNHRADGSIILARSRLGILHDAAIAHCAASSGVLDGILQIPSACSFDPAWVQCPAGAPDTSRCLTAEETAVAQKLYEGSSDAAGRRFEMLGFPLGSELRWGLSTAKGPADGQSYPGTDLGFLLDFPASEQGTEMLNKVFDFNDEWYRKLAVLAPLYNGADTNLAPFQKHGGKLILWHGGSDTSVQPESTIAYYQGVQKQLGARLTDTFTRFFLLPGVGHCSGGEGPAQIDVLSPLMAWAELHRAPDAIVVGKPANQNSRVPGQNAGGGGGDGEGGGGGRGPQYPYPSENQPTVLTRPIYPYPAVARYSGNGDRNDAANYVSVKSSAPVPQTFKTDAVKLFGPNNHQSYHVENGKLVPDRK